MRRTFAIGVDQVPPQYDGRHPVADEEKRVAGLEAPCRSSQPLSSPIGRPLEGARST